MPNAFTPEQEAWLAARPPEVQAVARQWPPTRLYRITRTGQHCGILAYERPDEGPVTLKVRAWRSTEYGEPVDPVEVSGVPPEQLEVVPLVQDTGS